jgi:hypothetical protein
MKLLILFLITSSINDVIETVNDDHITLNRSKKFFDFNDFVLEILNDILNRNVSNNLDNDCLIQLQKWNESLTINEDWALTGIIYKKIYFYQIINFINLKVVDSFGRKPSGIFDGNTAWNGQYSQCIGVREKNWNAKYCYLSRRVNLILGKSRNELVRFVS